MCGRDVGAGKPSRRIGIIAIDKMRVDGLSGLAFVDLFYQDGQSARIGREGQLARLLAVAHDRSDWRRNSHRCLVYGSREAMMCLDRDLGEMQVCGRGRHC